MGCTGSTSSGPYRADQTKKDGTPGSSFAKEEEGARGMEDDAEELGEEVKDHMPEPVLPTLLESAFQFARADDNLDTISSASSRHPSTVFSIPTPSIQGSHLDSLVNSSIRAEVDKESVRYSFSLAPSTGAPSEWGTIDGHSHRAPSICKTPSVGAPSVCGTIDGPPESVARAPPSLCATFEHPESDCSPYDFESNRDQSMDPNSMDHFESMSIVGSIAESRLDSQAYLQDLEAARILERRANSCNAEWHSERCKADVEGGSNYGSNYVTSEIAPAALTLIHI